MIRDFRDFLGNLGNLGNFREFLGILGNINATVVEKYVSYFFGLLTEVSTEIWICQEKIILSAHKATMDGFSWFKMDYVTISRIFWRDMKKVSKG